MILTVASGKGGTGKTTIATNLALVLEDRNVTFLDCDVEAPNGHLFLKPEIERESVYRTFVPEINLAACTFCGKCSELCQFGAIMTIKDRVLVFPELCHGCEGCRLICPGNAISEGSREVGTIAQGSSGQIRFFHGRLRISEAMSPPLIREVKRLGLTNNSSDVTIIDSPPGTSCPVIEASKGAEFIILVTEPTPFGLHDLRLAVDMVRALRIPFGVVINRWTIGNRDVWDYCRDEKIPILQEIPDDRDIAEAYSHGKLVVQVLPQYRQLFEALYDEVESQIEPYRKVGS